MTTLAFAGAGWVTAVHGLAARAVDGVEVVRVASRTQRTAGRRATQAGGKPCRLDELPGGADAVLVATPAGAHRREAERAVDGGAAALVETPLAATLADADRIVALAARGQVAYGENLVHSAVVAEAVRACRGIGGGVTHLEVRFAQGPPDPGSWRLDPACGGGVLFDLGVHALAVALLMGAPARVDQVVSARLTPRGVKHGGRSTADSGRGDGPEDEPDKARDGDAVEAPDAVDDEAVVVLGFDTGLQAEVRASWRAATPTWDAQAATPTSAVRLELVPEPSVELNAVPLTLPAPPTGLPTDQLHHLGYTAQLATLAADLSSGTPLRPGPPFGRLVLDIVCAAYTAARTGRSEPVPFTGDRTLTPHQLWRGG